MCRVKEYKKIDYTCKCFRITHDLHLSDTTWFLNSIICICISVQMWLFLIAINHEQNLIVSIIPPNHNVENIII